jgi:hypothetical protein
MTSLLGIKMSHAPVLSIIVMILIVTLQLVNKFLFTDKEKPNLLLTLRKQSHELGGASMPFLQASSIDMYSSKTYTPYRIVMIVMYYLSLLVGLMLTETVFGRYNMLLLLLVGVGINLVSPLFAGITCFKQANYAYVSVDHKLCCSESMTWYYVGIISSILLNYHFMSNKKVSTSLFIVIYLIIGLLLSFGQYKYLENRGDKQTIGCITVTAGLIPYLLGGAFTFGSLGLLFTKF